MSATTRTDKAVRTDEARLEKAMEGAAAVAVHIFSHGWSIDLDFSDRSISQVEGVLNALHTWMAENERHVEMYAQFLGAYIGEVLRRLGGGWVWWADGVGQRPAVRCGELVLFPHDQVRRRLLEGRQHNLMAYFRAFRDRAVHGEPVG